MMKKKRTIAAVLNMIAMPMMLNTMASNGDCTLKCDVVPRAACTVMQTISTSIAAAMVQRTICRLSIRLKPDTTGGFVSGMNHATVQRKMVIEVMNFIGLIHGLR